MKNALPPLLRGIGMLVILTAAIIAFCIARQHDQTRRIPLRPSQIGTGKKSGDLRSPSVPQTEGAREEVSQDSVVEDVLENVWFEILGFAGTGIFAASFFVEAYVRLNKKA